MAVSVAQLIAGSKLVSDNKANGAIDDTTDWLTLVNWAVESLWKKLKALDPGLFFSTYNPAALTGGAASSSIDLANATRFRSFLGLDLSPDTQDRRTIARKPFQERNQQPVAWWMPAPIAQDRAYELRGRTIVITPYEVAAGTYRVYFEQGPYLFVSNVDGVPLDWQLEPHWEWIATMAGRRALGIEESDTGPDSQRLAELEQEIAEAYDRDDGSGLMIADVEDF